MEFVRKLLEEQPMMALFLTVAVGTWVGSIVYKGFSLGVGAVLFVGLAVGWFAPKSVPAAQVGTLGLAIFLYAIGIQYGKDFFAGLKSPEGRKANLLALIGVLSAGAVTLLMVGDKVKLGYALGLFAGSGTSTPTLQAAIQKLGSDDPAVGYSVAYPFGVAGPILLLQLAFMILKPKRETPAGTNQEILEIAVRNSEFIGKSLAEATKALPVGVQIVAVRHNERNQPAFPESVLVENAVVLAVGPSKGALDEARQRLGEAAHGTITADRRDIDYLRVFVSKASIVGKTVGELDIPGGVRHPVVQVRRGDADLLSGPELVLEYGDRVGLLTGRANFQAVRDYFGDSIKSTAEFSYISIGIGLALGFLVGAIDVPVPGVGSLAIGLAGILVVGLVLGNLRRTRGFNWTIPLSASLVLRNLGLTIFLAQVGMASGPKFAATVAETGFLFLGLGAVILLSLALPVILLGHFVFRMPFEQIAGVTAGACGNAAILGYANKLLQTDKPDVSYAMIFPGMTVVKILFVDVAPAFYGG
jgi:putative transport protein